MILYSEGATKAQEDEANSILEALTIAYPNHPWAVRVYPGGFFIQHLDYDGPYGMNCKYKTSGFSWSAMKREIIMKAGEWLERSGLARRVGDGDQVIQRVEGIAEKWQPAEFRDEKHVQNVVIAEAPLRETPRPQALQQEKENGLQDGLAQA